MRERDVQSWVISYLANGDTTSQPKNVAVSTCSIADVAAGSRFDLSFSVVGWNVCGVNSAGLARRATAARFLRHHRHMSEPHRATYMLLSEFLL